LFHWSLVTKPEPGVVPRAQAYAGQPALQAAITPGTVTLSARPWRRAFSSVVTAVHGDQNGRLAGQDGLRAGGHPRVGDDHVDPRLEVVRDAEVAQRVGKQQRIGRDELVGQGRGERAVT
jgi:hypothetical protein